ERVVVGARDRRAHAELRRRLELAGPLEQAKELERRRVPPGEVPALAAEEPRRREVRERAPVGEERVARHARDRVARGPARVEELADAVEVALEHVVLDVALHGPPVVRERPGELEVLAPAPEVGLLRPTGSAALDVAVQVAHRGAAAPSPVMSVSHDQAPPSGTECRRANS